MVAIIIFTDIVGFSQLSSVQQIKLITSFNEIVYVIFKQSKYASAKILFLPTGDGIAIALCYEKIPSNKCAKSVILDTIRLHQWASQQQALGVADDIELRIGINYGVVEIICDINRNENIVGATVNNCQRIMDAANGKQTLISDKLYEELIGDRDKPIILSYKVKGNNNITISFSDPLTVQVKHEKYQTVRQIILSEPSPICYSNKEPSSKYRITIKLAKVPESTDTQFAKGFSSASTIACIILTGERFLRLYAEGKIQLCKTLKKFYVFIPHPTTCKGIQLSNGKWSHVVLRQSIKNWKVFFKSFKSKYPDTKLMLGAFKDVPYFGGSFFDWESPGGKIHISPFIWGVKSQNCPGYEMMKPLQGDSVVYNSYITGLEKLKEISQSMI